VPWLELSGGLMEQVRPVPGVATTVFEAAARESWLSRYTSVAGWDSFVEAAARRVVSADDNYHGEGFTARGGVFVKRDRPFRLRHIVFRGSTEVESDLAGSLRYAFGVGIDYTRTGMSAVLQSSRTDRSDADGTTPEIKTALFVAGTVEPPDQYFVEAMQVEARLLREAWNYLVESEAERRQAEAELRLVATGASSSGRLEPVVENLRRASAASEAHRLRVAALLVAYLERRRLVYAVKQWKRTPDDLYGPLDGEVLVAAAEAVVARLTELTVFLRGAQGTLEQLRQRGTRITETLDGVTAERAGREAVAADELALLDQDWRRASDSVVEALQLYEQYLAVTRRIAGLAGGAIRATWFEPLDPRALRRLRTLMAQPLH
jgi:hypothetical protein